MATKSEGPTAFGIGAPLNWLVGGFVGGAVSAGIFGLLLWLVDPEIITTAVPEIYGLAPGTVIGWAIHVFHGSVLGMLFGLVVTREPVLGLLTAEVETDFLAAMGPGLRMTLTGIVFGLAVWAIFPLIGLALVVGVGVGDPDIQIRSHEFLVGHLVFGGILGAMFTVFAETADEAAESESPVEES